MHGRRGVFSSSVYAAASARYRVHSCAENASHVSTSTLCCRPRTTKRPMLLLVGQIASNERYKNRIAIRSKLVDKFAVTSEMNSPIFSLASRAF